MGKPKRKTPCIRQQFINNAVFWCLGTENQTINNIEVDYTGISFRTQSWKLVSCRGNHFPDIYVPEKFNFDMERAKSQLLGKEIFHWGWSGQYSEGIKFSISLPEILKTLTHKPTKKDPNGYLKIKFYLSVCDSENFTYLCRKLTNKKYTSMLFANKIRELRESKQMLQRHISAALDMDNAMYCKIERGDRHAKREQIPLIMEILQADSKELRTLWLADQVTTVVEEDKDISDKVLKTAKENMKS